MRGDHERGPARCPVCGIDNRTEAFTKDGIMYRDCAGCGLRFACTEVNANLALALDEYETAYLQYLEPDAADERNHAALVDIITAVGGSLDGGPVLDVGCGSGKLVRYLRRRGSDAYGVEPAESLFEHFLAREPWFFRDLASARDAIGGSARLVLAIDVLEHVPDPVAFLQSVSTAMTPDGRLIISTPDAGSATAKALGRHWHHYNRFHLSLLSAATLNAAARRAGFCVTAIRRPGRYRQLGYVAGYFFEFGLRRRAPHWVNRLDRRFVRLNLRDTMVACLVAAGGERETA